MQEGNPSSVILEQLNCAYDGCFSLDPVSAKRSEQTFHRCHQALQQRGLAIRQSMVSGRWEITGDRK
jgi:hypothetical protein